MCPLISFPQAYQKVVPSQWLPQGASASAAGASTSSYQPQFVRPAQTAYQPQNMGRPATAAYNPTQNTRPANQSYQPLHSPPPATSNAYSVLQNADPDQQPQQSYRPASGPGSSSGQRAAVQTFSAASSLTGSASGGEHQKQMLLANNLWNAAMKALQSGYLPMDGILSMLPKFAEYISKEQLSTMVSLLAVDLCRSDFLEVGCFLGIRCQTMGFLHVCSSMYGVTLA